MGTQERAQALRGFEFLEGLSEADLEELAAAAEDLQLARGEILIRQGEHGDAMFFLTEGLLDVQVRQDDGTEIFVGQIPPGQPVGEIQVILGGKRSATVVANVDSRAIRISLPTFRELERRSPDLFLKMAEIIRRRLRQDQLAKAVGKLFGDVDQKALDMIADAAEWIHLRRGEVLVRQGDPADSWYILVTGRLKVEVEGPDGPRKVNELGRGESFGELGIFLDSNRTASVSAMRDCDLVYISRAAFETILQRRPRFMGAIARVLVRRIVEREDRGAGLDPLLTLTVVPLSEEVRTGELCRRLRDALAAIGPTLHVDNETLEKNLGIRNFAELADGHPAWIRVTAWLEDQETKYRFILLETDREASSWSRHCLRRSDRVLLAGDADDPLHGRATPLIERGDLDELSDAPRTLVLIHSRADRPTGTAAWLAANEVSDHFHLRWEKQADIGRLARRLGETSVGLVLGGGGAKGFAHIGVLRAFEELGIPIDLIGGTSIGSVISGMCAMGLSPAEIKERNRRILEFRPFTEYTLPLVSLVRSRRMEKAARFAFGETLIEDLWIDYFCISANLTTARMMVHERGSLWHATQASGALPGILVPVLHGREILVDGGIIDNLPGDVMRQRHRGSVIAVDVGLADDLASPSDEVPGPARILWSKLSPFRSSIDFPGISNILMRTTMLSSVNRTSKVRDDVDLYLEPPVASYGLLDFEKLDELEEVGYRHTMERAAAWLEDQGTPHSPT